MFQTIIKLILSILFLLCLLHLPYGYYQAVRFCALLGFVLLAHFSFQNKQNTAVIVYIGLAILFQPIFKIALGRNIWNIVDVAIAIALLLSLFHNPKETKNNS
jgi:hypothetical protein